MMELSAETIGAICTAAGFIIGQITKRERRLTKIETKLDIAIKDIDGIAAILGTKRSKGQAEGKTKEEAEDEE